MVPCPFEPLPPEKKKLGGRGKKKENELEPSQGGRKTRGEEEKKGTLVSQRSSLICARPKGREMEGGKGKETHNPVLSAVKGGKGRREGKGGKGGKAEHHLFPSFDRNLKRGGGKKGKEERNWPLQPSLFVEGGKRSEGGEGGKEKRSVSFLFFHHRRGERKKRQEGKRGRGKGGKGGNLVSAFCSTVGGAWGGERRLKKGGGEGEKKHERSGDL